jgi:hypothetical protein
MSCKIPDPLNKVQYWTGNRFLHPHSCNLLLSQIWDHCWTRAKMFHCMEDEASIGHWDRTMPYPMVMHDDNRSRLLPPHISHSSVTKWTAASLCQTTVLCPGGFSRSQDFHDAGIPNRYSFDSGTAFSAVVTAAKSIRSTSLSSQTRGPPEIPVSIPIPRLSCYCRRLRKFQNINLSRMNEHYGLKDLFLVMGIAREVWTSTGSQDNADHGLKLFENGRYVRWYRIIPMQSNGNSNFCFRLIRLIAINEIPE